jgi:two-component system nitrate/nitrite response regulator NarL
MIRLLVVDDHEVVRAGIRAVFSGVATYEIVAEAAGVQQALGAAAKHRPDVVLLDITLPDGSGLESVTALRAASPKSRVLMLSVHDGPEYVLEAVRCGAHGYLRKDASPALLRQAVGAVHAGGAFFGAEVVGHLVEAVKGVAAGAAVGAASDADREVLLQRLTAREREVLTLVAAGQTSKAIAATLGISVRTAEAHRDSIAKKTGVRSVAGLTRLELGPS